MKGYLTVEASFVMSTILIVYLLMIRSFLWIYDRCVMEQNMASLAVRCVWAETNDLEAVWLKEVKKLEKDSYLWVAPQEPQLIKKGFTLTITGRAEDVQLGDMEITYEIWRMNPCEWLRMKRKKS